MVDFEPRVVKIGPKTLHVFFLGQGWRLKVLDGEGEPLGYSIKAMTKEEYRVATQGEAPPEGNLEGSVTRLDERDAPKT